MKKWLVALCVCICACALIALAACSPSGEPAEPAGDEPQAGMANPWSEVATAEEAAQGAGVDGFEVPLGAQLELGPVDEQYAVFRCMEGIAELDCPVAAVDLTIRKGTADQLQDGDISGDYNVYAKTWTQDIGDVTVTCSGNRDGEATKTVWSVGDAYYCILAYGAGGDDDFGLSAADVNTLVSGIK